jgi:6-phosphogluconolactonase (cycloisomerase 2 family)
VRDSICIALFQVKFSADGNFLYTGARKDADILCWDIRYTSDVVYRLQRDSGDTNQRIQFDIEPMGRHLATGQSVFVASPVSHHLASVKHFLSYIHANM